VKTIAHNKLRAFTLIMIALSLATSGFVRFTSFDHRFHVDVLDVGQGDSILITTPEGIHILVDGGPGTAVLQALSHQLSFFQRRIDLLILTHPDADHAEGLISVLKQYKVGAVLRTGFGTNTATYAALEKTIKEKHVEDERVFMGDRVALGKDATFTILWPPQNLNPSETNEGGIVGQLSYRGYDFLLTADVGSATEAQLMRSVKPDYLKSEVLKVGHHGSKYSSSDDFLNIVEPTVAAISDGKDNKYGHPAPQTLDKLKALGAKIFRTDQNGTIHFVVGDSGLSAKGSRP
jgi:competence protein ComEC